MLNIRSRYTYKNASNNNKCQELIKLFKCKNNYFKNIPTDLKRIITSLLLLSNPTLIINIENQYYDTFPYNNENDNYENDNYENNNYENDYDDKNNNNNKNDDDKYDERDDYSDWDDYYENCDYRNNDDKDKNEDETDKIIINEENKDEIKILMIDNKILWENLWLKFVSTKINPEKMNLYELKDKYIEATKYYNCKSKYLDYPSVLKKLKYNVIGYNYKAYETIYNHKIFSKNLNFDYHAKATYFDFKNKKVDDTPLLSSLIDYSNYDLAKKLIKKGFNVNAMTDNGNGVNFPINYLMKRTNINIDIFKLLVKYNANINVVGDLDPPLSEAVRKKEIFDILINMNDVNVNISSKNNLNALHNAIIHQNIYCVQKLIEKNTNINQLADITYCAVPTNYEIESDIGEFDDYTAITLYPTVSPLDLAIIYYNHSIKPYSNINRNIDKSNAKNILDLLLSHNAKTHCNISILQ